MALNTLKNEAATSPTTIDIQPQAIHPGAEIHGVDLTQPLAPAQVQDIRAALLCEKRGVVWHVVS